MTKTINCEPYRLASDDSGFYFLFSKDTPTEDELVAMEWLIGLSKNERQRWLKVAENYGLMSDFWGSSLTDAWAEWKRCKSEGLNDELPEEAPPSIIGCLPSR